MAIPVIIETGYTKFNLSYPAVLANATPTMVSPNGDGTDANHHIVPGILMGILIPHIVCTVFIFSRIWSRLFLLRKWFLDDTLIVLAWVFSTAVCVVYSIASQSPHIRGSAKLSSSSTSSVPDTAAERVYETDYNPSAYYSAPDALRPYILRTYVGLILYQLCLCLTKLSILVFYLRIFQTRPLEKRLAWATVIAVLLFGCPLLFMSIFQCHPVAGEFFGVPMKCFTFDPLLVASTALHTATDAWLILLIIPCIVRLRDLPPRQKAALAVVLSLSIFVIAASLIRLQLSLRSNHRPSGDGVGVANTLAFFVMTIVELDMALICASAPTLRPVLAKLWPRLGMGEPVSAVGGRRRRTGRGRIRLRGGRRDRQRESHDENDEEGDSSDGSVDLTSVVSYHGYPWTQPCTPIEPGARSKNSSVNNVANAAAAAVPPPPMPAPPLPVLAHRTPTTLSLRSFMSSMAPRSRGQTTTTTGTTGGEDREGLLWDGGGGDLSDGQQRRRSSVGFDGYYDQYLGYAAYEAEKRRSGYGAEGEREMRSRRGSQRCSGRWGDSQESFVLGMNDPNSPSRLSPVSRLTGETAALPGSPTVKDDEKSAAR